MQALHETEGIEFVLVSNEASGAFMADVCWRLTGEIASCFGTYGPGACNLSPGVCCASLDRSAMLVLADELPVSMLHRAAPMNIDQPALFKPITKWQSRIELDSVVDTLSQGVDIALKEVPGPVYIGLPDGTQTADQPRVCELSHWTHPKPPAQALDIMEAVFRQARRPVLALGITAARCGVEGIVFAIAEKFQVPVVLTPMAKGVFAEDHDLYAGVLNHALSDQVGRIHQQADLVVGIGYEPVEIHYEDWVPDVPVLHLSTSRSDVDPNAVSVAEDVVGDLGFTLDRLVNIDTHAKSWDVAALAARREDLFSALQPPPGCFCPQLVLQRLREKLPEDGILTGDAGAHLHLIGQMWKARAPRRLLMTNAGASMGFGVPAAIAAKLCSPDKDVLCVTGDGGFLMSVGEMATARRLGTKVVFVVMKDNHHQLIHLKQTSHQAPGTQLHNDKPGSSNHYFGVPVLSAGNTSEFEQALDAAFGAEGPMVIEVELDEWAYEGLVLRGNRPTT